MKEKANPVEKFKYLLKGSEAAKFSSFILIIFSSLLIYKMRGNIIYILPLILGAVLVLWYSITHLLLKKFNPNQEDFYHQVECYRAYLIKREKYETTILFIWNLTVIPAYLYGKEINMLILISFMIITYLFAISGRNMFERAKKELNALELQNKPD
ncbi:hypothetical protein RM549_10195 [Salegentibacter sp. F188]|uniref:DUF3278 domain-containing protein n=1 Tax=Autumnicola patrickiae TaxID=3075591 RepID=A0ABU3E2F9_9FLAO|nr:hypothetical protein [Salegentibacter sp. F188]MDT0690156.1 hypothetical protein [Salegentibacter sp. F188]